MTEVHLCSVRGIEHRCADGSWQPGKVKDCELCASKRPAPRAKRSGES